MDCFGDYQKIAASCEDSFEKFHYRYLRSNKSNEIIVTESPNFVAKYNINKRFSLVQSWSFDELNKLSLPISFGYNFDYDHFIGVHACNTLIEWRPNENQKLEPLFKKIFNNHSIVNIITSPKLKQPMIVFSNGWVEFLDKIKSEVYSEKSIINIIEKNEKIIFIEKSIFKKRTIVYYIVENNKGQNKIYKSTFINGW